MGTRSGADGCPRMTVELLAGFHSRHHALDQRGAVQLFLVLILLPALGGEVDGDGVARERALHLEPGAGARGSGGRRGGGVRLSAVTSAASTSTFTSTAWPAHD